MIFDIRATGLKIGVKMNKLNQSNINLRYALARLIAINNLQAFAINFFNPVKFTYR